MRYLISGGGTGGHIYPALAIITEIKKNDTEAEILYVGTEKGLEATLVPRENIDFKSIRVKGMPRSINKESLIALRELFYGLSGAKKIIKEFRPDVVIGTGGYVCGPVVYQAKKNNIPSMIHEQNAFPGITNKILSRFVDRVAVTFEESIKYFKHPEKTTITGNPIRDEILKVDKEKAYATLNIDKNVPFILSFGGSGGQKKLNDAMLEIIKKDLIKDEFQLIHITGNRLYEDFMKDLGDFKTRENTRILPYMYEILEALNVADLVVTSSGAITLAEISAIGIPSILIPKGYTAENHQEYNARAFEDRQAAHVILEKDLSGDKLIDLILNTLYNKEKLVEMAKNSKKQGNIYAAAEIYKIINELITK